jgi:hypothetical protein
VSTRYADSDRVALIEKLRAMTIANGCTSGEEAAAKEKLRRPLEPAVAGVRREEEAALRRQ